MECYLDNSATTRCLDSAAALMAGILCTDYGNPSSLHHKGVQAEEYVRHAREVIAKTLKVTPKEIFFTSGGTESDNLALRGAAYANARQGKHLITTSIEHWRLDDVDLIEANEAFAAQAISVGRVLEWDERRVNVNGGAIALGHPIGASGCRILVSLVHEMIKRDARKGLATLCIGGGQGVALAVERA